MINMKLREELKTEGAKSYRLQPETILKGRYKIIEHLSSAHSNLYIAVDLADNKKKVVVKELFTKTIEANYRTEALRKFAEEVSFYKDLHHKNLAEIIDCFCSASAVSRENKHFIVMEYVRGKTLREIKEEKGEELSPLEVVTWIRQIYGVMDFFATSEPEILFYYLSPDHIMVTDHGEVKLINFGLGRFFRKGPFKSNQYMGITGYSAPEQYGIREISTTADIFGFGAVIYYLLTGDDPAKHPLKFAPVTKFNPSVSLQFAGIISKCLYLNRHERFQNFKEFAKAFEGIMFVDASTVFELFNRKNNKEDIRTISHVKTADKMGTEWKDGILGTINKYVSSCVLSDKYGWLKKHLSVIAGGSRRPVHPG